MQPHIYHRTVCLLTECMTSYVTATPCKAQMIIYLCVYLVSKFCNLQTKALLLINMQATFTLGD